MACVAVSVSGVGGADTRERCRLDFPYNKILKCSLNIWKMGEGEL